MRTKMLLILLVLIIAIPAVVAQDEDPDLIVATGELTINENGDIIVDGYVIAPAGSFAPGQYEVGDSVIITGYLLPDGATVQALSIEAVDDEEETGTDEEVLDEEVLDEETTDEEEDVSGRGFFCNNEGFYHPAGWGVAEEFEVDYDDVMTSFCEEGRGFGEIMMAYMMAEKLGLPVEDFLAARADGMGWGQIMKENDIRPNELFAGRGHGKVLWDEEGNFVGGRPEGVGGGRPEGVGGGRPEGVGGGRPEGVGGGRPDGVGGGKPEDAGGGNGGGNGGGGGRGRGG